MVNTTATQKRRMRRGRIHHRTKICVHITTRIWQGVQGVHFLRERERKGTKGTLFSRIIGSRLGYSGERGSTLAFLGSRVLFILKKRAD